MPKPNLGRFVVQQIEIQRVRRMRTARPLDEAHVAVLCDSIKRNGLLQPIGVSPDGEHFVVVTGNHRFAAVSRLGIKVIDAVILPEGMTENQLLVQSLHENHVRKAESAEAMLCRIQALAEYEKCTLPEAAKLAGVSPGTLSKIQKIVNSLSPAALELVRKHKIGSAISYEVARLAKNEQQQLEWLEDYVAGKKSREQIKLAATQSSTSKPKKLRINVTVDDVVVKATLPAELGYAGLCQALATLRSKIALQEKREIGFHLLPEVLKGQ
ncbi:ParB/RepB/Spo0J family partition protein [Fuerstiella marisgermanici]|uniref:Putative chromosome-partitioning protein ParB n=1 Tax=Fuerstiella marisgermanici TaxID=1891926 RepID=A0A1P8WH68_9PLAN|nr:ParB/RepB/Spo0J family partition protein [Fuerstiella marisgermanici]APZ93409.1 putative chromosome-partitioning protein ParB [Fuerstiella marisgermanici]